jgi:hypothetical protein
VGYSPEQKEYTDIVAEYLERRNGKGWEDRYQHELDSYSKWLQGEAPPWYQELNKTTHIVLKTNKTESKLQKERYALLNRLLDSVDNGADILIVQDGILVRSPLQMNLRKLSPDQLSNAETMEWEAAKKLYGSPARPITLIINTYDPKYKYSP